MCFKARFNIIKKKKITGVLNLGQGYETFLMLNSAGHEIFSANKYENANNNEISILMFISREIFMLSYVQQEGICNVSILIFFVAPACSRVYQKNIQCFSAEKKSLIWSYAFILN